MVRKTFWTAALAATVAAASFGFAARATADTLQTGAAAPDFSLPSQEDTQVSLSQYKGKWVVLYFYPKDMTTGCTIEAHNFQRDLPKYDALNAVVLGVSLDTVESHKTFCTKDSLTFKLLADPDHKVIDAYGVPVTAHGDNQVRGARHLPHLARRQDRQGLDRRRPQDPQRRRPRGDRSRKRSRLTLASADAKRPGPLERSPGLFACLVRLPGRAYFFLRRLLCGSSLRSLLCRCLLCDCLLGLPSSEPPSSLPSLLLS